MFCRRSYTAVESDRRRLGKTQDREGTVSYGETRAAGTGHYDVRMRPYDRRILLTRIPALLRNVTEIHNEHHGPDQNPALSIPIPVRQEPKPVLRAHVHRASFPDHNSRRVLHRYRQFTWITGVSLVRPNGESQGTDR